LKNIFITIAIALKTIFSCNAQENPPKIASPNKLNYSYETFVDSLEIPWGMSFINKNDLLVTEKSGILYRVTNGAKKMVKGLPPIYVRGQGGLLDVAVSPNFQETREIYFTTSSEVDTYNSISLSDNSTSNENLLKNKLVQKGINLIRKEYPFVFNETLRDFIETFKDELKKGHNPIEKFQLFLDVNYYPDIKDENDLNQISDLSNKIKKIEISNDKELFEEEKKLKNKLRSIQKKYSFLPQNKKRKAKGGHTALYKAILEGFELKDIKMIYKGDFNTKKGQHWGSRIVFDDNNYIYFTIGDRGNRDVNPQDITRDGGKVYRLNLDGTIPKDNPFAKMQNARKAIYSYGHRNPQGMVFNKRTKKIWTNEHGPKGGDEINIIKAGKNYGWPIITYGINYSGTIITNKTSQDGMEQPLYYWVPSIAPSGMAFSTSDVYPEWKNNLFVGSLKFEYLERLEIKKGKVVKREKVLESIGRVRNVKEGPDGHLYVAVEGKGILRLIPN
jgi:glucose/arabinose dehydrogenase